MKNFRSSGQEVTYTADQDRKSGDSVVIGNMVGILATDVKSGGQCSADVEGVFLVKKAAGLAVNLGDKLYFKASDGTYSKTNSDVPAGLAAVPAQAGDATVEVKLIPGMSA